MRILMTCDAVGGVFSFAFDLSRELCARGAEVALAVLGPRASDEQRSALACVAGLTVYEREGALEWMDDPWEDVDAATDWLVDLTGRVRPHVLHLNGYAQAARDYGVPKLVVAHSSVHGWWRAVHGEVPPARFDVYAERVQRGLERADLVVAPTDFMLQSLCVDHGYAGPALVIPNGADPVEFRPARKGAYFAAAGRLWDRAKNLELLVAAAPELPWPLRVAGEGDRTAGGTLEWLGRLPRAELSALLASAPVFLHPVRYEPFGLAPLEAALCGAALVLGDIPSLREVWRDAALYVRPDAPAELVRAASALAENPERRAELGARARERAERFSLTRVADAYLACYRRLACRPVSRAPARSVRHERVAS